MNFDSNLNPSLNIFSYKIIRLVNWEYHFWSNVYAWAHCARSSLLHTRSSFPKIMKTHHYSVEGWTSWWHHIFSTDQFPVLWILELKCFSSTGASNSISQLKPRLFPDNSTHWDRWIFFLKVFVTSSVKLTTGSLAGQVSHS